jgi:hypothetical protein
VDSLRWGINPQAHSSYDPFEPSVNPCLLNVVPFIGEVAVAAS